MLYRAIHTAQKNLIDLFQLNYPESTFLFIFRITVSLIALLEILSLKGDLFLFYSASKTIIPQELMYMESGFFKYLYPLSIFLKENNLYNFFYPLSLTAYLISLLFLAFGLFTRLSALSTLIFQLIIFKSFAQFNYGYDNFMTMSLFYCFIFPVGKYYSIDKLIFKKDNSEIFFNYQRVLQIHLTIAYFFSGVAKALDSGWWNGKSVWNALISLDNNYSSIPIIYIIAGVSTVLLELSHPILVYFNKTRKFVLIAMILMHTIIGWTMQLYAFSAIMIAWNIASFGNLSSIESRKTVHA